MQHQRQDGRDMEGQTVSHKPPPLFDPASMKQAADARAGVGGTPESTPRRGHPIAACKSCGARIFYARIRKKKDQTLSEPHPFDAAMTPERKGYVIDSEGVMHHNANAGPDERVFRSHFSTCPNAPQHRKG